LEFKNDDGGTGASPVQPDEDARRSIVFCFGKDYFFGLKLSDAEFMQ
jgi:hypothetical protein